jgi:hypothetical protein
MKDKGKEDKFKGKKHKMKKQEQVAKRWLDKQPKRTA